MSQAALNGLRILDCGEMVAAPYAAKLFAHMGADVVKVEPPDGDPGRHRGPFPYGEPHPERGGLHLYLDQGKRSVVIDWGDRGDRDRFLDLVRQADAVIVSGSPQSVEARGLNYDALCEVNPRIVVTTITPFGMTGPRRDWAATELTEVAAGGWLYLSPRGLADSSMPPLKAFGQQAEFQGGINGANATMGALFAQELTDLGQHVDVSIQACIASNLESNFMIWSYAGRISSRLGGWGVAPMGTHQLSDGLFYIACVEEDQWVRLVEWLGSPEWANSEVFVDRRLRGENRDAVTALLEGAMGHLTCQEAYEALGEYRVPSSPVFDMAGLMRSNHLAARDFFVEVDHPDAGPLVYPGAPFKLERTPWDNRRPAPRLGEHTQEVMAEWERMPVEGGLKR